MRLKRKMAILLAVSMLFNSGMTGLAESENALYEEETEWNDIQNMADILTEPSTEATTEQMIEFDLQADERSEEENKLEAQESEPETDALLIETEPEEETEPETSTEETEEIIGESKQVNVTIKVLDVDNHPVEGIEVKISPTGKSVQSEIIMMTDTNGEIKEKVNLRCGATYEICQKKLPGHYSTYGKRFKINEEDEDLRFEFNNQPTVVKIGVIDNVSGTSPYTGSYVAGATIVIIKDNEVLKTITTERELTELVGLLEPDTKYKIIQTAAPAGYIVGAVTGSGAYSVGKMISLSSKTKKEKTVVISADTVKVLVSRKGYDSRTETDKMGKKEFEYKNLNYLAGANIEIRDKNGNVVRDKEGKPVTWTSDGKGGRLIEGALKADTEYRLVETVTPKEYNIAEEIVFRTNKSGRLDLIDVQTAKESGTINVRLSSVHQGKTIKVNDGLFCALFLDEELNQRYIEGGVKKLSISANQEYAQTVFENVPVGVYYVAETNQNGEILRNDENIRVKNPEQPLYVNVDKELVTEIVVDVLKHEFGDWREVSSATVFAPKKEVRACNICMEEESRDVGSKLEATVEMNATEVPLKNNQKTNALKVIGLADGDYVKEWKSSNTKIFTVSKNGVIKAGKKKGKAILTVTMASGLQKKIPIVVNRKTINTSKIVGLPKKITLRKGKKLVLKPLLIPITSSQNPTYSSSNKKIVTVNKKGVLTAKKKGKSKIIVKSGKKKITITVTVIK